MVPSTTSIHAVSLVFDQSMIAKNAAKAPRKSLLKVYITSPESITFILGDDLGLFQGGGKQDYVLS